MKAKKFKIVTLYLIQDEKPMIIADAQYVAQLCKNVQTDELQITRLILPYFIDNLLISHATAQRGNDRPCIINTHHAGLCLAVSSRIWQSFISESCIDRKDISGDVVGIMETLKKDMSDEKVWAYTFDTPKLKAIYSKLPITARDKSMACAFGFYV